jgi:hypothetical protein
MSHILSLRDYINFLSEYSPSYRNIHHLIGYCGHNETHFPTKEQEQHKQNFHYLIFLFQHVVTVSFLILFF